MANYVLNTSNLKLPMDSQEQIKTKFNRVAKALSLKPSLGFGTGVSTTRITDGLACEIREGDWTLRADMPKAAGGMETGPTPGVLGRGALGSCLAIGYMLWASKLDVPIKSLEVEIRADWDDGGTFGVSDVVPGYLDVQYTVRVESDAPEEEVLKAIEAGDEHSPYLDVFSRGQTCHRKLEILPLSPESS